MEVNGQSFDSFVRQLMEYNRTVERRMIELEIENSELNETIQKLNFEIKNKNEILSEYKRRNCLLEFSLRREKKFSPVEIPPFDPIDELPTALSTRAIIKQYLNTLGISDLGDPSPIVAPADPSPRVADEPTEWGEGDTINVSIGSVMSSVGHSTGVIVTASDDSLVKVFQPNRLDSPHVLRGHDGPVHCVDIRPDGMVVSGGADGRLIAWRTDRLASLDPFPPFDTLTVALSPSVVESSHSDCIWDVKFHPATDMPLIAAAGADGRVSVWRISETLSGQFFLTDASGERVHITLRSESGGSRPSVVCWHPTDDSKLIAGFTDGTVCLFDVKEEKLIRWGSVESGIDAAILSMAGVQESSSILIGQADEHIRGIDFNSPAESWNAMTIRTPATGISYDSGEVSGVLAGGRDGVVRLWDLRNEGDEVQRIDCGGIPINSIHSLGGFGTVALSNGIVKIINKDGH
jgi:WD40 repeat protein